MRDELGGQIMKQFVGLRAKTHSYLKDNNDEDKKTEGPKEWDTKKKIKFQNYKNCLETAQIENKINHLEKSRIDVDILKKVHQEFIKNNKLILKLQQIFRKEKQNDFTDQINKIALSSNDDKRIQSIYSIEICEHRTSKDLLCKK